MPAIPDYSRLCNARSSNRILNLAMANLRADVDSSLADQPLLIHPTLNTAVYAKTRLTIAERSLLDAPRSVGVRVIFPTPPKLDRQPHTLLIGERGFPEKLTRILREAPIIRQKDFKTLELLDRMPSFNPLLLRDMLRQLDQTVGSGYFRHAYDVTPDVQRFVERELADLSRLAATAEVSGDQLGRDLVTRRLSHNAVART